MTVAELIDLLQQVPQHLPVTVCDESEGVFHEFIDFVYHYVPDEGSEDEDPEGVVIVVNECV